jgi:hypothetical protein
LPRLAQDQLADGFRQAITSGQLQPGEELRPLRDIAEGQGVPLGALRRAASCQDLSHTRPTAFPAPPAAGIP